MALLLSPRFRPLGEARAPKKRIRTGTVTGVSGPFQATQLWNGVIRALQTQVETKRRRQHLRAYRACFTGADAVDVVLSHLMQNGPLGSHDLSRIKGARLCQALMDRKIFEPVGTKLFRSEREVEFEDANSSLYRFPDSSPPPSLWEENTGVENAGPDERDAKREARIEAETITNPLAQEMIDIGIEDFIQRANGNPNFHANITVNKSVHPFPKKAVEEIWKQQTLLRLLQLIHLPFLEGVLESPIKRLNPQLIREDDLIISNTFLDREVTLGLNLPVTDKWLSAAIECLEYFPDQLFVMVSQQLVQNTNEELELNMQKKILFDVIVKYYNQKRDCLLTDCYSDVHSGILELLEDGKKGKALEASQLFLRLLLPNVREELRRLLTFMAVASKPDSYKIQKQFDNKSVVMKTLAKAVLQPKSLLKVQTEHLINFLLENHSELFKTPLILLEMVSKKFRSLLDGEDPDATTGFIFCQRLPGRDYERQKQTTIQHLQQLIHEINSNSSIPLKQKKKLLKEFQKHHPPAFDL
ncbi:DEP domain-containing protein 4 [Ornithorhynchus anatinus]|uniref:DEP domain containing 4 n=1 Tax=Ornithorhynchus anatinus TaxID=9258 RepID=F6PY53_ORNAN|nr:DEP domain-containing protein 4 [Ornithorhynchus anatinus]